MVEYFARYIENGPEAIYSATAQFPVLVKMAHKYFVKDLYNYCVVRMLESLDIYNVADYYATPRLLNIVDLKKACIVAIKQKWAADTGSAEFFWTREFGRFGFGCLADYNADCVTLQL